MLHRFPLRVYFEDTDAGGIVYHSNYLNFAERARTEMVRELGIDQRALLAEGEGFAFAVRRSIVDFLKPARLDDRLEVESVITEVGGASADFRQTIRRTEDGAVIARLDVRVAFISLKGKPMRIPPALRASLQTYVSEGL